MSCFEARQVLCCEQRGLETVEGIVYMSKKKNSEPHYYKAGAEGKR